MFPAHICCCCPPPPPCRAADPESVALAQLNCIHLMHSMAKLLPGWLPDALFNVVLTRWRSPEFKTRCAAGQGRGAGQGKAGGMTSVMANDP